MFAMTSQSVTRFAYILICDMYALPLLLSVLHVCLCFICLLMLNILFFYATMYEYMSKRPHFHVILSVARKKKKKLYLP
jgi:predicted membrane protein